MKRYNSRCTSRENFNVNLPNRAKVEEWADMPGVFQTMLGVVNPGGCETIPQTCTNIVTPISGSIKGVCTGVADKMKREVCSAVASQAGRPCRSARSCPNKIAEEVERLVASKCNEYLPNSDRVCNWIDNYRDIAAEKCQATGRRLQSCGTEPFRRRRENFNFTLPTRDEIIRMANIDQTVASPLEAVPALSCDHIDETCTHLVRPVSASAQNVCNNMMRDLKTSVCTELGNQAAAPCRNSRLCPSSFSGQIERTVNEVCNEYFPSASQACGWIDTYETNGISRCQAAGRRLLPGCSTEPFRRRERFQKKSLKIGQVDEALKRFQDAITECYDGITGNVVFVSAYEDFMMAHLEKKQSSSNGSTFADNGELAGMFNSTIMPKVQHCDGLRTTGLALLAALQQHV